MRHLPFQAAESFGSPAEARPNLKAVAGLTPVKNLSDPLRIRSAEHGEMKRSERE